MFCYRLRKYIAAYVGVLGGVDAVVFAGGIGENAPAIRRRALVGLDAMGLAVDGARNEGRPRHRSRHFRRGAPCRVFVVPTNEELLIAQDTFPIVRGLPLG